MAKKKISYGAKVGLGLVAGTAAATAAGTYFLYSAKDAAKNRKKVKGWVLKAKGEVLEGIEKVRSLDEKDYGALVDRVTQKYAKIRSVGSTGTAALSRELKNHWKHIHKAVVSKRKSTARKRNATPKKKTARRRA